MLEKKCTCSGSCHKKRALAADAGAWAGRWARWCSAWMGTRTACTLRPGTRPSPRSRPPRETSPSSCGPASEEARGRAGRSGARLAGAARARCGAIHPAIRFAFACVSTLRACLLCVLADGRDDLVVQRRGRGSDHAPVLGELRAVPAPPRAGVSGAHPRPGARGCVFVRGCAGAAGRGRTRSRAGRRSCPRRRRPPPA